MIEHCNGKHTAFMQLIALQFVRLSRLLQVQIAVVTPERIAIRAANAPKLLNPRAFALPERWPFSQNYNALETDYGRYIRPLCAQ